MKRRLKTKPRTGPLVIILAVLCCVAFVGLTVIGSVSPDTKVVRGSKIKPWHVEAVRRICKLEPDEEIMYFYSASLISVDSDGNLFTNKGVYSYAKNKDGEIACERAKYPDIGNITVKFRSESLEDSTITVSRLDGSGFILLISNEAGGDHEFMDALTRQWEASR